MAKIFICNCHGSIGLPEHLDFGPQFPIVTHQDLCSEEGRELVKKEMGKKVLIAACTPRIAERFFSSLDTEFVNIREQSSFFDWPASKIAEAISAAVEKIKASTQFERTAEPIRHRSVLIIGAGISGLEAARIIGLAGLDVHLIERESFLGGTVAKLDRLYPQGTPNSHTTAPLINDVVNNRRIRVYTAAELVELSGRPGNYTASISFYRPIKGCDLCKKCEDVCPVEVDDFGVRRKAIYYLPTYPDTYQIDWQNCNRCGACVKICDQIRLNDRETIKLDIGAVLNASGLHFYDAKKVKEYGYDRLEGVMNTIEFERRLTAGQIKPKRVVIICCAGSRDHKYLPYCSRVCCLIALKEAKLIKDRLPDTQVYVTYIDMRAYGTREKFYETLREGSGVTFVKGKPSEVRRRDGGLVVTVEDALSDEMLELEADCVVLSTGFVPDEKLLKTLGIKSEPEQFPGAYTESSLCVDANPRGIFFAGAAAFPVSVSEAVIDARNASVSTINFLMHNAYAVTGLVAKINSDVCAANHCRICVGTCPYGAIYEKEERIEVDEAICMGCGICSGTCMAGASQLISYTDNELRSQIGSLAKPGAVIALLCKWGAYHAADKAGYERKKIPQNVSIIRIPCTGRVESQMILQAFSKGVKGVLIGGCYPDACHYIQGNFKARNRCQNLKSMFVQLGLSEKSLRLEWFGKEEAQKLFGVLEEMSKF